MDLFDLLSFLNGNYYMLVPALWILGYALKQTPMIPDWTIIWILLVISVGLGTFAFGFSVNGIINGVIAAGVAVLGHQIFKQTVGGKRTGKKEIVTIERKVEEEEDDDVEENDKEEAKKEPIKKKKPK